MRMIYRQLLIASLVLTVAVWSSAAMGEGSGEHGKRDRHHKSSIARGIGHLTSNMAKSGIHGRELAEMIHNKFHKRLAAHRSHRALGEGHRKRDARHGENNLAEKLRVAHARHQEQAANHQEKVRAAHARRKEHAAKYQEALRRLQKARSHEQSREHKSREHKRGG